MLTAEAPQKRCAVQRCLFTEAALVMSEVVFWCGSHRLFSEQEGNFPSLSTRLSFGFSNPL